MSTYKVGDLVWVRANPSSDRYPAVIELALGDGTYTVLWCETEQHVRVPGYAIVGEREPLEGVDDESEKKADRRGDRI